MSELDKIRAVEIRAEIRQVKSLVDGSVNITLNLGEDNLEQARVLLGWLMLPVKAVIEREQYDRQK